MKVEKLKELLNCTRYGVKSKIIIQNIAGNLMRDRIIEIV